MTPAPALATPTAARPAPMPAFSTYVPPWAGAGTHASRDDRVTECGLRLRPTWRARPCPVSCLSCRRAINGTTRR